MKQVRRCREMGKRLSSYFHFCKNRVWLCGLNQTHITYHMWMILDNWRFIQEYVATI